MGKKKNDLFWIKPYGDYFILQSVGGESSRFNSEKEARLYVRSIEGQIVMRRDEKE